MRLARITVSKQRTPLGAHIYAEKTNSFGSPYLRGVRTFLAAAACCPLLAIVFRHCVSPSTPFFTAPTTYTVLYLAHIQRLFSSRNSKYPRHFIKNHGVVLVPGRLGLPGMQAP